MALSANSILIRRDGYECAIEDSAAPIHDRDGEVTGAVIVFHDVSVSQMMVLEMSHRAQHDILTDLPNRVLFNDRLTQAISMARRNRSQVAVLFLDLDGFKNINDSLGHTIGDHLLQSVAARLSACVRKSDTVSRWGGDEFVILLAEVAHAADAAVIAAKILTEVQGGAPIGEHRLQVTASIGVSTYPDNGEDAETLIKNADAAMYHAKESGRNKFQVLSARHESPSRQASIAGRPAALCIGAQRVNAALPAEGRSEDGSHHQRRSAATVATSKAGTSAAGAIPADRRKQRPDCSHWPLGAGRGVPANAGVAGCRLCRPSPWPSTSRRQNFEMTIFSKACE